MPLFYITTARLVPPSDLLTVPDCQLDARNYSKYEECPRQAAPQPYRALWAEEEDEQIRTQTRPLSFVGMR